MLFKPDEVTSLKNGRMIQVEVKEGDVRVLKRNFCGVYELFRSEDPLNIEYFEDLNFFKNRYGSVHKRFPLYNISRQRLDIYPVAESMGEKDILKWFEEYGKIKHVKTSKLGSLTIKYYRWISDMENTISRFQILHDGEEITLNIAVKNMNLTEKVMMVG